MNSIPMQWSDIWLLLSIIIGGGQTNDGATLESVIRAGDGINHAIFTHEQVASGLYRLSHENYITTKNGKYFATEKANNIYDEAWDSSKNIYQVWDYVGETIRANRYTGPLPNPADIYEFHGINKQTVAIAAKQWHNEATELMIQSLQKEHGLDREEAIKSIEEIMGRHRAQFLNQNGK